MIWKFGEGRNVAKSVTGKTGLFMPPIPIGSSNSRSSCPLFPMQFPIAMPFPPFWEWWARLSPGCWLMERDEKEVVDLLDDEAMEFATFDPHSLMTTLKC